MKDRLSIALMPGIVYAAVGFPLSESQCKRQMTVRMLCYTEPDTSWRRSILAAAVDTSGSTSRCSVILAGSSSGRLVRLLRTLEVAACLPLGALSSDADLSRAERSDEKGVGLGVPRSEAVSCEPHRSECCDPMRGELGREWREWRE